MLYFAYGSNLNVRQMTHRCPRAQKLGPLVLPGYRLVFRGVADIIPDASASVQGGLWEITPTCEEALDRYEGVRSGLYSKEYFTVSDKRGGTERVREVLVYTMNEEGFAMPADFYLNTIRVGFEDFGLPTKAITEALAFSHGRRPRRAMPARRVA